MRLWHQSLIPLLPRQQLLGQHRECCALRGKGWGRKHATVDYVFTYRPSYLVAYHWLIMDEMERRGYKPDDSWRHPNYRGKELGKMDAWCERISAISCYDITKEYNENIYREHNDTYLNECVENLQQKGIEVYETLD